MLRSMDRIPIGKTPSDGEADNVVPLHVPSSEHVPPSDEAGEADDADDQEMSYEQALAADLEDPQDEQEAAGSSIPGAGVAGLLEQGMRVGAGMFSAGATAFAQALRATMPGEGVDSRSLGPKR